MVIGLLLVFSGIGGVLLLMRFEFIRKSPVLLFATALNPGIVGTLAGIAFIIRPFFPETVQPILYVVLGLIALSLPIIIIFLPRVMMEKFLEVSSSDEDKNDNNDNDDDDDKPLPKFPHREKYPKRPAPKPVMRKD
jgi:hypothetical protein